MRADRLAPARRPETVNVSGDRGRAADGDRPRTGAVTSVGDAPLVAPSSGRFADRHDAGRRLAARLERFAADRPVVIGMPRGGVPVAAEVARALDAPLDVAVVRKIGAPQNPEFALGAVAEGGVHVLSSRATHALGLSDAALRALIVRAERELREKTLRYRGGRAPLELTGRTAILVDDGLATGRSAHAALLSLRKRGAARVILAVPVAAVQSVGALTGLADEIVCVEMPEDLWAVGLWYEDFRPTSDEEVAAALEQPQPAAVMPAAVREVAIDAGDGLRLAGALTVPAGSRAVVAFAHGSGSSRMSPRNRAVASALSDAGFATLLFDLLSEEEGEDRANVFDIPLLASRLLTASAWLAAAPETSALRLCYFGASTGAAAALSAAADLGDGVGAVISRGGRPDLARGLAAVRAPTLLIVGGADTEVLELNRQALRQMRCAAELAVVPGATHLFQEPGALERVARLAIDWLNRHCPQDRPALS